MLNTRVGGFAYVPGPCGSFKQTPLRDQQFLPLPHPPMVFTARSYEALFSWPWNPGLRGLAGHAGMARSPGVPPSLYPPQVNVGPPIPQAVSTAALLQPPHHILAAPFTCLDECFFFKSLVVRLPYSLVFWQFWLYFVLRLVVILPMVLQGGKACLPMPPS